MIEVYKLVNLPTVWGHLLCFTYILIWVSVFGHPIKLQPQQKKLKLERRDYVQVYVSLFGDTVGNKDSKTWRWWRYHPSGLHMWYMGELSVALVYCQVCKMNVWICSLAIYKNSWLFRDCWVLMGSPRETTGPQILLYVQTVVFFLVYASSK